MKEFGKQCHALLTEKRSMSGTFALRQPAKGLCDHRYIRSGLPIFWSGCHRLLDTQRVKVWTLQSSAAQCSFLCCPVSTRPIWLLRTGDKTSAMRMVTASGDSVGKLETVGDYILVQMGRTPKSTSEIQRIIENTAKFSDHRTHQMGRVNVLKHRRKSQHNLS